MCVHPVFCFLQIRINTIIYTIISSITIIYAIISIILFDSQGKGNPIRINRFN